MKSSCGGARLSIAGDLELAELLTRSAADVALVHFRRANGARAKRGASDVVTDADQAAQDAMVACLAVQRPADGVVAEEGPLVVAGERQWLLDPIDGTLAYHRGLPSWSTAVALRDVNGWVLSAVFDPLAGELFTAHREAGAFVGGRPLRCRATRRLSAALIHTWLDAETACVPGFLDFLERLLRESLAVKSGGSGSQAMAWVAAGRLDAFVEVYPDGESEWDWLPGRHLVERAGGAARRVGDWRIAAATAALADAIEALLPDPRGAM